MAEAYVGLLFIGDPHLAHRPPGARRDDYGRTILGKLAWCLDYARQERLLPCILGDLFHWPRDNANWLLGDTVELLRDREVLAIYGNHDIQENTLAENDSLSVLVRAGLLTMLSETRVWQGKINGRQVHVGGTNYGQYKPGPYPPGFSGKELVFWLMHHDILLPDYQVGRMEPEELPGIHVVVNGHIHRRQEPQVRRRTTWLTPGNIARTARSTEAAHVPAVLRIDVDADGWRDSYVTVPHRPPEEVFVATESPSAELPLAGSGFVRGLEALMTRKMHGEGLQEFLDHNLGQFSSEVQAEIRSLASEVMQHG